MEEQKDGVVINSELYKADYNSKLKPDMWASMSFSELSEQKTILFDRYDFFLRQKKTEELKFYSKALDKIEAIIQGMSI